MSYKEAKPEKVAKYEQDLSVFGLNKETAQKDERVFFYDQAGINKPLYREYGRTPKGTPFIQAVSGMRFARISMMSLRNHKHQLIGPETYAGTCNTKSVVKYFEKILPSLDKGSIVIMDNASYHKSKELQAIFDKHKMHLVFLPPYSPQYNPIEKKWSQVKHHLRYYMQPTLDLLANLKIVLHKLTV